MQESEVSSFAMGYHEYHKTWTPIAGDVLQFQMDQNNAVDKYTVAVINKDKVNGHKLIEANGSSLHNFIHLL